jgi:hypothetical protein
MRWAILVVFCAVTAACGATQDGAVGMCGGQPFAKLTDDSVDVFALPQPCGRTFARNALASFERKTRLTAVAIDCYQDVDAPNCVVLTERGRCMLFAIERSYAANTIAGPIQTSNRACSHAKRP